jgi:hypothetical protein
MFRNIFTLNWLYSIIDYLFFIKLKIRNFYINYFIDNEFVLDTAILYTDSYNYHYVTYYFNYYNNINKKNKIDKIDNNLIKKIYDILEIKYIENEDARLKLEFRYKNIKYILYYPIKKQIFNNTNNSLDEKNYFIPYPPYNDEIINNYRKSIINPHYNISTKNSILYSLFMIDSKDICNVELTDSFVSSNYNGSNKLTENNLRKSKIVFLDNNLFELLDSFLNLYKNNKEIINKEIINKKLLEYINKIKTPFNDFGLLYHCPVKVKWILEENCISENDFKNLYIKFFNMYFDDSILDLKEHYINIKNLNDFIISDRMYSELKIKNDQIVKELEDLNK